MRRCLGLVAFLLAASPAAAASLQIATPYQSTGTNAGSVGATGLTATSTRWAADFGDESGVYAAGLFGALDLAPATVGDFFRINLGSSSGLTDTFTITFTSMIEDPILYLIDVQGTGGTITVTLGGSTFVNDTDSVWNGNVLTVTNGFPSGSAFAAIKYQGTFGAGSVLTLQFDYTAVGPSLSTDTIGIGIGTQVPEPACLALLAVVGASLIGRRGRRAR
jgi:hypothetical protein